MLQSGEEASKPASTEEEKHVARLQKRIKAFEKDLKQRAVGWKRAREYADGDVEGDDEDGLVRVNLVGSILETIQPAIYAKAPEIAVTVDESPTRALYPVIGKFAKTLEDALNVYLVKDAKLKVRGKKAVRSTLTATLGWLKVIYQREYRDDPVIRNRINDTQDNVEQIKTLIAETGEDGGSCAEQEAKLFELQQQLTALEAQVEVVASEGLVIDNLSPEDLIILDSSVRDIDEFMQAGAIAHKISMTVGEYKKKFNQDPPKEASQYVSEAEVESEHARDYDEDDKLIYVYEVWSLQDLTVYTICHGSKGYIRAPYQPTSLGQQWYPFFGLQLRRVDGKKYPRSMVEQLIELQDEYNTRRTNASEHRRKNIPVRLINKSAGITDDEIAKINNRSIGTDVIGVTVDAGGKISDFTESMPEIPFNSQMYDTSDILFDMEKSANTQDAASGAIRVAKTATEAEIAAAGQQGRTGENLDAIEDWLTDVAIYSAQLLLQNMTPEQVKARFGPEAIWPNLTKQELFDMVNIGIRAGSTAKPNKMRERDQWIQLLPEIQKTMAAVSQAKQQGNMELANAMIGLLDETLSRFDEKLDAKSLLGIDQMQADQPPQMPGAVLQGLPPEMPPQEPEMPGQEFTPQPPLEVPAPEQMQ